jgi:hypothetical protein
MTKISRNVDLLDFVFSLIAIIRVRPLFQKLVQMSCVILKQIPRIYLWSSKFQPMLALQSKLQLKLFENYMIHNMREYGMIF